MGSTPGNSLILLASYSGFNPNAVNKISLELSLQFKKNFGTWPAQFCEIICKTLSSIKY